MAPPKSCYKYIDALDFKTLLHCLYLIGAVNILILFVLSLPANWAGTCVIYIFCFPDLESYLHMKYMHFTHACYSTICLLICSLFFFLFVGNHCLTFPCIVFTFCNHIFSIVLTLLFNSVLIQGTDSVMDDCLYHLVCPCCTLSQV